MAVTLGYRASRSLAVRIRGIISRQAVYIFSEYEGVAKPEWLPYLTSRVENADAPIMNLNTLVHLWPHYAGISGRWRV